MTVGPERIGSYPVEREVGRGGMGVVYLGRDPRLDRRVAIKVLVDTLAADPERLARFEREARLLASLHHPNIAGIYGLEEDAGRRFLVLEYVEGETLAERLQRGPMAVEEAIETCRQIAAALEAAHENGVIHRDLKPGNVKLTPAGEVKVLDFGLAKGGGAGSPSSITDLSQSPTLAPAATLEGVILGTAAYMSPEQARGRAVDKRTDIWAFGCVLFECLTGQQAFSGETGSDTIARILQGEPTWSELPARTPERLRGLLRRCLDKDARRRLRDIGDAKIELEDLQAVGGSSSSLRVAPAPATAGLGRYGREIGIAVLVAVISVAATKLGSRLIHVGPPDPTLLPSRLEVLEPPGAKFQEDAQCASISPDGRTLAYVALDSLQNSHIWVRPVESLVAKQLPGTEGSELAAFWSPDSRKIGFFTAAKLKVAPVDGNTPAEALCDVKRARGGAWAQDGTILFAPFSNGPLYRISAEGGEPKRVTTLDSTRGETAHRFPILLPDGKHFLYSVLPARDGKFDIRLASLDSPKGVTVLSSENGVVYASGHLLYTRGGSLVAQRWSGSRPVGEPISIGDAPIGSSMTGAPTVSASLHGTIVYLPVRFPMTRLVWMDLHGHELRAVPLDPGPYQVQGISPDNRFAVLGRPESSSQTDLWTVDLERGVATRLTYEAGNNVSPKWSHDGKRIAYMWENQSPQVLKIKSATGGPEVQNDLTSDPLFKQLDDWTRDGQYIVYDRQDPVSRWDIWILPMTGERKPRPYLVTPFNEQGGRVSPDGRWLAYTSDESGSPEVYVQSFPTPGGKYQVTSRGGVLAGWTPDGKGLVYSSRDNPRVGIRVDVLPGATFRTGSPRVVAEIPDNTVGVIPANDGKRLLCSVLVGQEPPRSVTVLMNWPAALAKR